MSTEIMWLKYRTEQSIPNKHAEIINWKNKKLWMKQCTDVVEIMDGLLG